MQGFKTFINKLLHPSENTDTVSDKKQYLIYAFISLLILIFTFPKYFPQIQTGPDGSEMFAFNYLFYHHIQFGTRLVFTYGPLGFICSPQCMGNNLATAMIFSCVLRLFFIYSFLILGYIVNKSYRVLHIIIIIGLCNMTYIDFAFLGGVVLGLLIYQTRKEITWLLAACLVTALALFVKSSYGLMCTAILFSYGIYTCIFNKRFRVIPYILLFMPFFFLFIWFLLYHNLSGIFDYAWSMYQFSKDNSNAMQIEVANHWGILFLALICFYIPLLFTKNELTRILYVITAAALYAAFKYSFAREQDWHQVFLLTFVILICALFLLLNSGSKALAVMLPLASIGFLYANMVMTNTYNIDDKKRITGIGNFIADVIDYNNLVKNTKVSDSITLHEMILDDKQRALIDNSTVDCYPMELTYVAANTLNWTPRPNMQIGAYNPWLDNHNASFLSSPDAPRFYIWQLEYRTANNYSLDEHYLLNDEPQTIYNFLNHYELLNNNVKTAIFGHSDTALLTEERITGGGYGCIDKWMWVPSAGKDSVIRGQINFANTLKGSLRKTIYKDVIYMIDYLLDNGTVRSYRFVPANAVSGLWINPLVTDITDDLNGQKVDCIRIRVTGQDDVADLFKVNWMVFRIK